jgi:hypothetical protein
MENSSASWTSCFLPAQPDALVHCTYLFYSAIPSTVFSPMLNCMTSVYKLWQDMSPLKDKKVRFELWTVNHFATWWTIAHIFVNCRLRPCMAYLQPSCPWDLPMLNTWTCPWSGFLTMLEATDLPNFWQFPILPAQMLALFWYGKGLGCILAYLNHPAPWSAVGHSRFFMGFGTNQFSTDRPSSLCLKHCCFWLYMPSHPARAIQFWCMLGKGDECKSQVYIVCLCLLVEFAM